MGYALGVDIGTTYTAAAVWRDSGTRTLALGSHADSVPSVVHVDDAGNTSVAETAARRELRDPAGLARRFKRRLGDPDPVVLHGRPFSSDLLTARLLGFVLEQARQSEGEDPERVVLTHPAAWGPYHLEILQQAARLAGLARIELLSEPEAVARHYAAQERLEPGAHVAVFDLGGGTFDATILERTPDDGFRIVGEPDGIDRLGGEDFDQAVLGMVLDTLRSRGVEVDPDAPDRALAMIALREECRAAKEQLSVDTEALVSVAGLVPDDVQDPDVRIVRSQFEDAIRGLVEECATVLERAVTAAGLEPSGLDRVLLAGGSSRIPLVAETVAHRLQRPIAVDVDPKYAVALGAARTAGADLPADEAETQVIGVAPAPAPTLRQRLHDRWPAQTRPVALLSVAGVLLLALAGFALLARGGEEPAPVATGASEGGVPDVRGLPRSEAMTELERRSFIATTDYELHPTVEKGSVIRQDPDRGTVAEPGTTVDIVVSSGAQGVLVPDVVGTPRLQATEDLRRAGLLTTVQFVGGASEAPTEEPAGDPDTVVRTDPGSAQRVALGGRVLADVAAPRDPAIPVPEVVGRPLREARGLLEQVGFVVDIVSEPSIARRPGIALETRPGAETLMESGSTVTVVVSIRAPGNAAAPAAQVAGSGSGSGRVAGGGGGGGGAGGGGSGGGRATPVARVNVPRVTVPDLIGRTQDDAERQLQDLGFAVQARRVVDEAPEGEVIGQQPRAGRLGEPGSTVELAVSGGPEGVAVPAVAGQPLDAATVRVADAGLVPIVRFEFDSGEPDGTVLGSEPAAGRQVAAGSRVVLRVAASERLVAVPNVAGLATGAAIDRLGGAGFGAKLKGEVSDATPGQVLRAEPGSGTRVGAGTVVTLIVAVREPDPEQLEIVSVTDPAPRGFAGDPRFSDIAPPPDLIPFEPPEEEQDALRTAIARASLVEDAVVAVDVQREGGVAPPPDADLLVRRFAAVESTGADEPVTDPPAAQDQGAPEVVPEQPAADAQQEAGPAAPPAQPNVVAPAETPTATPPPPVDTAPTTPVVEAPATEEAPPPPPEEPPPPPEEPPPAEDTPPPPAEEPPPVEEAPPPAEEVPPAPEAPAVKDEPAQPPAKEEPAQPLPEVEAPADPPALPVDGLGGRSP